MWNIYASDFLTKAVLGPLFLSHGMILDMKLKVKKLRDDARIPTRAHKEDAGMDLYAYGNHTVEPHRTVMIPTGVAFEIEEGCVGLIWDKSSIGSKGLKTLCGVIDAGYRGEVSIMVNNLSNVSYTFEHGHKVAQMLIQKVELCDIEEAETLNDSIRGTGAFGSTGK